MTSEVVIVLTVLVALVFGISMFFNFRGAIVAPTSWQNGLFLDDQRYPDDVAYMNYSWRIRWTIVRDLDQFVQALRNVRSYDVISFDYHLGNAFRGLHETTLPTGVDAMKKLIELQQKGVVEMPKRIMIHTQDPDGRRKLRSLLEKQSEEWSKRCT